MGNKKYTNKNFLLEEYIKKNKSMYEIANEHNTSRSTIMYWMNKYGIDRRPSTTEKGQGKKYRDSEWLRRKYVDEKLSTSQIAEICNTTKTTILDWLENFDIPKRPKGRRKTLHPTVYTKDTEWVGVNNSYEMVQERNPDGSVSQAKLHRLCAVAWFGYEEVKDKVVHHKNGIPWDNRKENIEIMTPSEHSKHHYKSGDFKSFEENQLEEGWNQNG